jgi:hypothetical protein
MLLGLPFGLTLSMEQVDQFLIERTKRKINHWSTVRLNSTGRAVIANGVFVLATLYFLSIWAGSKAGLRKVISKIRNYLFSGSVQPARARVAWSVVCARKKDGGLNIVNPLEAVSALMSKWVISACEPSDSNFKMLMRYRLSNYQPHAHGRWSRSLDWFSQPHHKASTRSKIWNRMTRAWKTLVNEVEQVGPRSYEEWLSSPFWWTPGVETIGPDFSRIRASDLFNKGLQFIHHAWCENSARIIPAWDAMERFGLINTEFDNWGRISRTPNEIGGRLLLRSSPRPKKGEWIGLFPETAEPLPVVVF